MMSEYVLPELPPDHKWQKLNSGGWLLQKRNPRKNDAIQLNMCWIDAEKRVKVWKTGQQFVVMGQAETLQQSLNMSAALLALGEDDE